MTGPSAARLRASAVAAAAREHAVELSVRAKVAQVEAREAAALARVVLAGLEARTPRADKVNENRLRRMAGRQGLTLSKSRAHDRRAADWGTYLLVDATGNSVVAYGTSGGGYGLGLDEVERILTAGPATAHDERQDDGVAVQTARPGRAPHVAQPQPAGGEPVPPGRAGP